MFADYKKSVISSYLSMKRNRQLHSELEHPSPGKLKRCFGDMLRNELEKRDLDVLQNFFNPKNEYDSLEKSISSYDSDKLKPLVNLMKGDIDESNNDANYKLLALLIGFEPRPYTLGLPSVPPPPKDGDKVKGVEPDEEEDDDKDPPPPDTQTAMRVKPVLYSTTVLALIIVLATVFCPAEQHMIWRTDRYHAIAQTALVGDTLLVSLDRYRLKKFRKIMQMDTVSTYSIGRLWYLKTDNKVELFTIGGKHPIHTERRLKPLTKAIYDKYLRDSE